MTTNDTDVDNDGSTQYRGNFYNFFVAAAGKGLKSTAAGVTIEDSICPCGWRVPKSSAINGNMTTDKSLEKLLTYAGSSSNMQSWASALRAYPYSFVRAGRYHYGYGAIDATSIGWWWQATVYSEEFTYYTYLEPSYLHPSTQTAKGMGLSLRCVNR